MSGHTPGPWRFDENSFCVVGANGEPIAGLHVAFEVGLSAREAGRNARLIVAAPELLSALTDIANDKEDVGCFYEFERLQDVARAAIARAEGKP